MDAVRNISCRKSSRKTRGRDGSGGLGYWYSLGGTLDVGITPKSEAPDVGITPKSEAPDVGITPKSEAPDVGITPKSETS